MSNQMTCVSPYGKTLGLYRIFLKVVLGVESIKTSSQTLFLTDFGESLSVSIPTLLKQRHKSHSCIRVTKNCRELPRIAWEMLCSCFNLEDFLRVTGSSFNSLVALGTWKKKGATLCLAKRKAAFSTTATVSSFNSLVALGLKSISSLLF